MRRAWRSERTPNRSRFGVSEICAQISPAQLMRVPETLSPWGRTARRQANLRPDLPRLFPRLLETLFSLEPLREPLTPRFASPCSCLPRTRSLYVDRSHSLILRAPTP